MPQDVFLGELPCEVLQINYKMHAKLESNVVIVNK
jgi:hypothetical protein